jgi:hypothetical protein
LISVAEALAPTQTEHGSSRIAELQRCPTAHDLKYTRQIFPVREAAYFEIGRLTHACLHYINSAVITGEEYSFDAWQEVIAYARTSRDAAVEAGTVQLPAWDEIDPIDEASRLVEAYYGLHGEANGGWPAAAKLLHAELFLESKDLKATCRADLVLELDGEIIVPDTKTRAKSLPKDRDTYARELRTNEQFLRLSALTQEHFQLPQPPAVWLDAIVKTKVPSVDRLLLRFNQSEVDCWKRNQRAMLEVESALHRLPVVRNYHQCAPPIGQRCWAFDFCHGTDEMREKQYRKVA